jgi:hypothetical protein
MTEMIEEPMLRARFDTLANTIDDSDWSAIVARLSEAEPGVPEARAVRLAHQRRAGWSLRRGRGARYSLATLVLLFAAVVTAVAFGWPQDVINFLTAPSAPKKVKNSFGAQNVIAPPGMNPHAIPGKARKIMAARFDATGIHPGKGGWHVLYVTPTSKAGFCYEWTRFTGTCHEPTAPVAATHQAQHEGPLGVTWMGNAFPQVIAGYVIAGDAQTVQARFADGSVEAIPVTWVSQPINAGFFIYPVPAAHQNLRAAVRSIVALDANGKVLAEEVSRTEAPLDREQPRTLPDGTRVGLSGRAEVATARKLISFRATNGSKVWLWVMNRRGGGRCYVFNQGSGCVPSHARARMPAFAGGFSIGTRRVLFFAQTKPQVASIELRYQDGTSEQVTPTDGFVLHEVTPEHYPRGKRLTVAVATASDGRVLFRQQFQPKSPGVYPCKTPISRGYGVKECP